MDLKNLPPAMVSQLVTVVEDSINSSRKQYAPQPTCAHVLDLS
jgi:hypothetical protein